MFRSAPVLSAVFAVVEGRIRTEEIWKGWWPSWAKAKAFENAENVIAGSRTVEIKRWDRESKEFIVQAGDPLSVGVKSFYYPLWKATVNGRPTEISMDQNGAITVPVSSEVSTVRLAFEEPVANKIAYGISAIVWLIPLFVLPVVYVAKFFSTIGSKPLVAEEFDYS
jgi:hypothetical protein